MRFLEYIAAIYQRIIPEQKRYSKRMTEIPASECFVIYNGFENYPEEKTLKLSDMFIKSSLPASSNLEISVKVYNINKCKDTSKLLKCIPLLGYKKLVEYVYNAQKNGIENPVDYAVKKCINEGFLEEYLKIQRMEVQNMLFGDYDYDMDIKVQRQEAWEDGAYNASVENAKKMLERHFSMDDICFVTGLPSEKVIELSKVTISQ